MECMFLHIMYIILNTILLGSVYKNSNALLGRTNID